MIKAKIFEVLKTFSIDEHSKFRNFVNSDYCNNSLILRQLYTEIDKYSPDFDNENLTRENLFQIIYPGKAYREGTIVNLLSGLYKLSEDFIIYETFNNEEYTKQRYLIRGLGEKRLDKFLVKNYNEMYRELNETKIQDEEIYNNMYGLSQDYISSNGKESAYIPTSLIQNWHDKFIDFFVIKILDGYVFMLNQKKYGYEHDFKMNFMEPVIKFVNENSADLPPSILIYFNLMMLLKEEDEQYYLRLKSLANEYPEIMKSSDRWSVYLSMVNYCQVLYESGIDREKNAQEVYELHRTIIDREIYKISPWHPYMHHRFYLNAVQNGLLQKDFVWTENFIKGFNDKIIDEYKTNAYNLCYALFYFCQKDYEKTLVYLSKVISEDPLYFLHIKALTLQVFYELKLYDNIIPLIDSYKHYLKEKPDIPARYNIQHKNFITVVNRLLKVNFDRTFLFRFFYFV